MLFLDTPSSVFDDPSSPQFAALQWLLEEDEFEVCPNSRNLEQRFVVAVLYFATNGSGWKSCSSGSDNENCDRKAFLSSGHECGWGGVHCTNTGKIIWLHMDENNMVGSLPDELGGLTSLEEIIMDDNKLSGQIPGSLGSIATLQVIDLDNNTLSGELPENLFSASSLKVLDIDHNALTGTLSTKFGQLTNLYFLQLDMNSFTGGIPSELAGLNDLKYLSFFKTTLDGPISQEFCGKDMTLYGDCRICIPPTSSENCCTACLDDSTEKQNP